ncbi:MAG: peptidoglycan DD-metalloendopeptidase family protein [Candidatus Berkelbacteria bacterium]|nr:peptidoglycan DD-metalloendopeptidase family protein [Candidatus Berkelbacteria bacterium]
MKVFEGKAKFKILFLIGAFLIVLSPVFASAASVSELQQKRDTLARDIQKNKELAAQKKKEAEELQRLVSQLDGEISTTQGKINNTQGQITKTQNEINSIIEQIAQKEKELEVQQENQNESIRVMYETVNKNTLEILASSDNLSQVITYGDYLDALEIKIESTIAEIEKLKSELNTRRIDLEKKKIELNALKVQLQAQKANLNEQRSVKSTLLGQTKAEEKTLKDEIAQAQKEQNQINAQLAAQAKKYSGPTFYGDWAYPIGGAIIVTCEFHCPDYPYRYVIGEHTGVDLSVGQGSPVYASGDGVVSLMLPAVSSALAYVFIDHGNGISTGYLHLSATYVSPGQIVKKGEIIGLSGGARGGIGSGGLTTGPHLHFEFRVNNVPVNPAAYLQF